MSPKDDAAPESGRMVYLVDGGVVTALVALAIYFGVYYLTVEPIRHVRVMSPALTGVISLYEPQASYHTFDLVPQPVAATVFHPAHVVDRFVAPDRWKVIVPPPSPPRHYRRVATAAGSSTAAPSTPARP